MGRGELSPRPHTIGRRIDMRRLLNLVGDLLFAVGMGGLAVMAITSLNSLIEIAGGPSALSVPIASVASHTVASIQEVISTSALAHGRQATAVPNAERQAGLRNDEGRGSPTPGPSPTPSITSTPTLRPTPTPEPSPPITGLRIPSIGLQTKVVPAEFVEGTDGGSWNVPAFVAGHAEFTAGAGAAGNAVLIGHVDSIRSGDVFHNLSGVSMGDSVEVWSGNRRFDYQVVAIWSVPRTDGTVMQPTPKPSITLITCTGQWLPLQHDFSHRLVVRAELVRKY